AIGNRRREGESGGVQLRQIDIEVDGKDRAGRHGWQSMTFAGGIGAGKIDAELVAEDESDNRADEKLVGACADAYQDARVGREQMKRLAVLVQHRDAEHLGAAVAIAMIDVGDTVDGLGRTRRLRVAGALVVLK